MHGRALPRCAARAATLLTSLALAATSPLLGGCADETYASAEGKAPPYVLKEGCMFSIVCENGRAGVGSMEITGLPGATGTTSTSFGDYSITVSECTLIANSHDLPVYED